MERLYAPMAPAWDVSWRLAEARWDVVPASASGLDARAVALVRKGLSQAVEQALWRRRQWGMPLPQRCPLAVIRQRRFDPDLLHLLPLAEQRQALAQEVRLTLAWVLRVPAGEDAGHWFAALEQQCQRLGGLYRALVEKLGNALLACSELEAALEAAARAAAAAL